MSFFIPPRQFWVEEVKNFIFPLWNPYYYNGHPLFATLQPGVLYPLSVFYLFLPFDWAFNLNIELHFALAGIFTYYLARAMKVSQGGALISAIGFMFSGYLISVHNLLSTLLSVTWVPLFFLCYFSALKNNRIDHAILTGIVGTVMFLGGGVEVCYLTFGVAFFLTLFPELVLGPEKLIKIRRRLFLFLIFCSVFLGLSAVQLIPFLELSEYSIRSEGLSYLKAGIWSLHPFDLIEFFLPDQYGLATDIKKYWAFENWLKTIYMGGIPFILASFYLRKWDRRAQGFLLLFFISLGFAMGKNALFHPFLYDYLPFYNKLRYPVKFIFLAVLILSLAAGLGYDYFKKGIAQNNPNSKRWAQNILIVAFLCMTLFGFINIFNDSIITYFKAVGWDAPLYNETESNIFNFKRFLAFSSLFCLVLFLYSKPQLKKPVTLMCLITLLIFDMFFAHFGFYHKANFKTIQQEGENAKFIKSDPDLFRIFVTPKTENSEVIIKKDGKDFDIRKEKFITGLLGNERIFYADGIGVTPQYRWKRLMDLVKSAPAVDSTNLLNLMNVKYVISTPPITSSDFELVHSNIPVSDDPAERKKFENLSTIKIYENKKLLPRAFLVPHCRVITSEKEYKETLASKEFDPEKILLLDREPEDFPCGGESSSKQKKSTRMDSYKSNAIELSINTQEKQFLFLSDSYYPGWKAYIDDEEAEILRANYLFRSVIVGPGEHKVRFEYEPLSFRIGLIITLLTILICGVYFLKFKPYKFV